MSERHWERWLFVVASLLCAAILAAPLLASTAHPAAAALLSVLFAPLCHQVRDRSFLLLGFPLAVCVRCTGIYLGVWLGTLGAACKRAHEPSRRWILLAFALMAADVGTELAGLRPPLAGVRFATGFLVGIGGSVWLVDSVRRLEEEIKCQTGKEPSVTGPKVSRLEQSGALARTFW